LPNLKAVDNHVNTSFSPSSKLFVNGRFAQIIQSTFSRSLQNLSNRA
jgi:hypothetical protein